MYLLSVSEENYWYSLCVLIVSQWGCPENSQKYWYKPVCTYCQSVGITTGTACVYLLSVSEENYWYSLLTKILNLSLNKNTGTACVYLLSVSGENYWYSLCVLIVSQWGELLVQSAVCSYCQSWGELLVQPVYTYCQSVRRTTGTTCVYLLSNTYKTVTREYAGTISPTVGTTDCTTGYTKSGRTTGTACVYLLSVSEENYWYNLCVLIVSQ